MNETLKNCPFCGGEAEIESCVPRCFSYQRDNRRVYFATHHCSVLREREIMTKDFDTPEEAITAWNRRAEQENKPLTLEELRGMDGEPVWAISGDNELNGWFIVSSAKHDVETEYGVETIWWLGLYNAESEFEPDQDFYGMKFESDAKYGAKFGLHLMGWVAYRSKPKEETK
jgi:hypothetical protein